MKNVKIVKGILKKVNREPNSVNGNPRYSVMINGVVYKTRVDAPLGYKIPDFFEKAVVATVGEYYSIDIIDKVEELS